MDSVTASRKRLEYAKLCIEIGIDDNIPEYVDVLLNDGTVTSILVEVPWLPPHCKNCRVFWHSDKNCTKQKHAAHSTTQVWKRKVVTQNNPVVTTVEGGVELLQESLQTGDNGAKEKNIKDGCSDSGINHVDVTDTTAAIDSVSNDNIDATVTNESATSDPHLDNVPEPSVVKKSRGRPPKDNLKTVIAGSTNRFAVLSTSETNVSSPTEAPLKKRAASSGVAALVNELKSKKKDRMDKVKHTESLSDLGRLYGNLPWVLGGDFNVILNSNESSNSSFLGPFLSSDMKEFQDALFDLNLCDHPFFGPTFTWSNKHQDSYLARKLDRVIVNHKWFSSFPKSHVEFQAPGISDHCLAITWLTTETHVDRPKPFKFFNFWAQHPEFMNVVRESWQTSTHGSPMQNLFFKLKLLKTRLKSLNQHYYSDISARVKQKKLELETQQLLSLRAEDSFHKELLLQNELKNLEEAENIFLRQKAKVQWLKDGDKCTKFFHSAVSTKSKRETIRVLIDDNGNRLETYDTMASELIEYFTNMIGTENPEIKVCDQNLLQELLQYSLPSNSSNALMKDVPLKIDIHKAFDSLHWGFVLAVLKAIGLPTTFIKWVEAVSLELVIPSRLMEAMLNQLWELFVFWNNFMSFLALKSMRRNVNSTAVISPTQIDEIKRITGFNQGYLPVRYLGVPLVTRKLSDKDCIALIDNIRNAFINGHEDT
ncbi:uncharacterized protein LOC120127313 [Hibiscus syriacus]|uniref:uncharacterized protein LOC120127313 n=1 Tax=Hibiscus syriacus TaxID=106335 RepID=UPI00192092F1|nr:uncharacterized protein LOC120127313 [Hibiscus syriacus]